MSDPLHHECAVAAIRLLKPLSYYAEKYGNPLWAFNKLFLLMEKQHNRGQDGAGIGCIKLNMPLGEPYMFRHRDATGNALSNIFSAEQRNYRTLCERGDIQNEDPDQIKSRFNYGGELLVGHMRYGASSARFDEGICHPFTRRTNWITRTLMLLGNFGITNAHELAQTLIERGQHPVLDSDTQTIMEEIGYYLDEAHNELYRSLRDKFSGQELQQEISSASTSTTSWARPPRTGTAASPPWEPSATATCSACATRTASAPATMCSRTSTWPLPARRCR